jgi:hypothetical protein
MRTGKAEFERMQRVSMILAKRYSGMGLAQIGAEQDPPVTAQAIHSLIQRALGQMPQQGVAEIRALEALRLDKLLAAVWPGAMAGDIAAVDRCLAISARRSRLLGLDKQPGYYGRDDGDADAQEVVRVEIVGSPEPQRLKWLEERSERLREIEAGDTATTTGTLQ